METKDWLQKYGVVVDKLVGGQIKARYCMTNSGRKPRFQNYPPNNSNKLWEWVRYLKRKYEKRRDTMKGQNHTECPSLGDKRRRALRKDGEELE